MLIVRLISYKRMNQPDTTPDRLLAAARALFGARGFERASVRAITRAAGANLGAVTYHFGSKDRLRDAVLADMVGGLAQRLRAAADLPLPARERLPRLVAAVFDYAAEHPDGPPLLVRWVLQHERLPAEAAAHQRALLDAVSRVIREGTAAGEFRAVNPVFAAFSLLSQCVWFHLIRATAAQASGLPLDQPEAAAAMQAHIADVLLRSLAPDGGA